MDFYERNPSKSVRQGLTDTQRGYIINIPQGGISPKEVLLWKRKHAAVKRPRKVHRRNIKASFTDSTELRDKFAAYGVW